MRSAARRRAPALGDPSGDRRRGLDRDLLAEDRAHGDLEGVPRARRANAGMRGGGAAQQNVARQLSARSATGSAPRSNIRRTRSTIASNARGSPTRTSSISAGPSPAGAIAIVPVVPADRNRSLISIGLDDLDPGRGAGRQEPDHLRPVVWRPVGEAEAIAVRIVRSLAREFAKLGRRSRKRPADLAVEAAQAAESGRERDLARSATAFRRSASSRSARGG